MEAIPGATPLDDLSGLKIKAVRDRAGLNAAEAENIRRAIVQYLSARPSRRMAPFDARWFKRLHREMFGNVWKWAGMIRTTQTNIGAAPELIEGQMHEMALTLEFWRSSASLGLADQACILHHRAVAIHPFLNGNGRWARLLANIWLKRNGRVPVDWPETIIGDQSTIRGEYLTAIRAADAGDLSMLQSLHEQFTPKEAI